MTLEDIREMRENAGSKTAKTPKDPFYAYSPPNIARSDAARWIHAQKELHKEEYVVIGTSYWYLDQYSCVQVKRNAQWFDAALPLFRKCWDTIQREKDTGYEHRAAKSRKPKGPGGGPGQQLIYVMKLDADI